MSGLSLDDRQGLWHTVIDRIERYLNEVGTLPVSPPLDPGGLRAWLGRFRFEAPVSPEEAVHVAAEGLTKWQVHTSHPAYFGLFNPASTTMGIAADALVAAFNPQMAAWSHNPFANEVEMHLVRAIGEKFGYNRDEIDGTFCSGGMEANHTAGTTSAGVVDPLADIADLCRREDLWFHTDAAWGGAAVLLPELRTLFNGIEQSDSITFDAHKWFSVPMGAGLYVTRQPKILDQTFRVTTAYMPKDATGMEVTDPHLHSIQWSRRFIGLKVFLSLLVAGWDGYIEAVRHQTAMGNLLRTRLMEEGWEIANSTPLPVVCFVEPNGSPERQRAIAASVVASGQAWVSPTVINGRTVIRACITHYGTTPAEIETLMSVLNRARG